jgi:hypothetical protein
MVRVVKRIIKSNTFREEIYTDVVAEKKQN